MTELTMSEGIMHDGPRKEALSFQTILDERFREHVHKENPHDPGIAALPLKSVWIARMKKIGWNRAAVAKCLGIEEADDRLPTNETCLLLDLETFNQIFDFVTAFIPRVLYDDHTDRFPRSVYCFIQVLDSGQHDWVGTALGTEQVWKNLINALCYFSVENPSKVGIQEGLQTRIGFAYSYYNCEDSISDATYHVGKVDNTINEIVASNQDITPSCHIQIHLVTMTQHHIMNAVWRIFNGMKTTVGSFNIRDRKIFLDNEGIAKNSFTQKLRSGVVHTGTALGEHVQWIDFSKVRHITPKTKVTSAFCFWDYDPLSISGSSEFCSAVKRMYTVTWSKDNMHLILRSPKIWTICTKDSLIEKKIIKEYYGNEKPPEWNFYLCSTKIHESFNSQ